MIKTVTINLSGQIFQMDENAYEQLRKYLESIRRHFANTEGHDEIVADIETRIAEMFLAKISSAKQSITLDDVNQVIAIMGRPEQIESEEQTYAAYDTGGIKKRLFRDPDNQIIGGVCSGLAAYLGIDDPLWVRLLMLVFLVLSFGTAFLIYVILMIIIPKAKTASEKLQMRGSPVNIENIEKAFRQELQNIKHNVSDIKNRKSHSIRAILNRFVDLIVTLIGLTFRAAIKLLAVLLVLLGIFITLILAVGVLMPLSIIGFSFPLWFQLIFENDFQIVAGALSLMLLMGVPAFVLIFSGIRLLLGEKTRYRRLSLWMSGLWFLALLLALYVLIITGKSFSSKQSVTQTIELTAEPDTLHLKTDPIEAKMADSILDLGINDHAIFVSADKAQVYAAFVKLNVAKSDNDRYMLELKKYARGKNRSDAVKRAVSIRYMPEETSGSLTFPSHFSFDMKNKYRAQQVNITLFVPEGKVIFLSPGTAQMIHHVENITDITYDDMAGHHWKMTMSGLVCLDCEALSSGKSTDATGISYDLSGYNEIEVNGNLNVHIRQGSDYEFVVKGDEQFIKNFNAQKDGNRLKIGSDLKWKSLLPGSDAAAVYITTPVLRALQVNGINKVRMSNFKTDHIKIEINGASDNVFEVEAQHFAMEINGASKVLLRGSASSATIESSGASEIKALNFKTKSANITLSGAGTAKVYVTEKLNTRLRGVCKLHYKGSPVIVSDISEGSSISRAD